MNFGERIKEILTNPDDTFPVLSSEETDVGRLFQEYILIVAALPAVGRLIDYGSLTFGLATYAMTLAFIYIAAYIFYFLADNFGSEKNLVSALKMVAYTATPWMVAGLLSFIGGIGWLLGLAGSVYSLYLLYKGLPVFMGTPEDKRILYMVVGLVGCFVANLILSMILLPIFGAGYMMSR